MSIQSLLDHLREEAPAAIWSRAVSIARSNEILLERDGSDSGEWIFNVQIPNQTVSPRVTLWTSDDDGHCDCAENFEPCPHTIACALALKEESFEKSGMQIRYEVVSNSENLAVKRSFGNDQAISMPLSTWIGGYQSGRIKEAPPQTTQSDFAIDLALGGRRDGQVPSDKIQEVVAALYKRGEIEWNGKKLKPRRSPFQPRLTLAKSSDEYVLQLNNQDEVIQNFKNGAVILNDLSLHAVDQSLPQATLKQVVGRRFDSESLVDFLTREFAELNDRVPIDLPADLPYRWEKGVPPRIEIRTQPGTTGEQVITPRLVYGDPAFAEVIQGKLHLLTEGALPVRQFKNESRLIKKLRETLYLQVDRPTTLNADEARSLFERIKEHEWLQSESEIKSEQLQPNWSSLDENDFPLEFVTASGKRAKREDVLTAWKSGRSFVSDSGGGWFSVPIAWLNQYGEEALRVLEAMDDKVASKVLTPLKAEIEASLNQGVSQSWKRLLDSVPSSRIQTQGLRPYQVDGIRWLHQRQKQGMGCLLGDDMGLGKTRQALLAAPKGALVICPRSVLNSWKKEAESVRPKWKVHIYFGPRRKILRSADLTITTYGVLRQDIDQLTDITWPQIMIDESQTIKNPRSQTAQSVYQLKSESRIALSGTPIENSLLDLWSQFRFLNPALLGPIQEFEKKWIEPIKQGQQDRQIRLKNRISPFLLRRTKEEVAKDLPSRTEMDLTVELSEEELTQYQIILTATQKEVRKKLGEKKSVMSILESLLRLRQVCCHPTLVPGLEAETSTKLEELLTRLEELQESGRKTLVFSQWTSMLDLIQSNLEKRNLAYSRLDGSTTNRDKVIQEFKEAEGSRHFLISLKAGGVGLTLTEADHVFLMDPWWNPAVERQAMDRAHRIGQEKPVFVYRLIARGTIEERIVQLSERKKDLAQAFIEDQDVAQASLTQEDILELISD